MDREKLNKKAEEQANHSTHWSWGDRKECFISGANWLMQQPLSERLTDAEIAKARAAYKRAEEGCNANDDIEYAVGHVVKTVLNEIFGADLFK